MNPKNPDLKKNNPVPFIEHLYELRFRLLIYIVTLIALTALSFYFYPIILQIMLLPINQKLFYTSPGGGLDLMIRLSLLAGFIFSLPMLLYQTFKFIEPSLPLNHNLKTFNLILSSFVLTVLGLAFAYFISLPASLYFLSNFSSDQIQALITTNEYFGFVSRYLLGFALFFQLPLILFLINNIYSIKVSAILKFQKYVIVLSFILAAILTPTPDFINQAIMAAPLIALYYFSTFILYLTNRRLTGKN